MYADLYAKLQKSPGRKDEKSRGDPGPIRRGWIGPAKVYLARIGLERCMTVRG
jgi:hypothetical protein